MGKDYKSSNKGKNYNSKGKSNSKGRSGQYKSSNYGKSGDMPINYDAHTGNDIGWWNKVATLFEDVTRVPFNKISGRYYPHALNMPTEPQGLIIPSEQFEQAEPGIMRINYVPGIGVASNYNDAPNRAFQSLWSAIYSKTTGILEFPPYMLGLFTVCAQSIAQNIAQAKRVVKISHLYSARNAYYPRALITAAGFDPDTIIGHQDEIRVALNDVIRDFNSLTIPAYIDVFKRHYTLCKNVYADQDSIDAQLYIFTPESSFLYSDRGTYDAEVDEWDGKACALTVRAPNAWTPGGMPCDIFDFINFIKLQLSLIRNSTDTVKIMGSLLRAMPDSAFISIDPVTVDEVMIPVVEDEISYQIHNSTVVGYIGNDYVNTEWTDENSGVPESYRTLYRNQHLDIRTDPLNNVMTYVPRISNIYRNATINDGYILNTFKNSMSKDEIMLYTRLMSDWKWVNSSTLEAKSLGTEFITNIVVYVQALMSGEMMTEEVPFGGLNITTEGEDYSITQLANRLTLLNRFHRAPRIQWAFESQEEGFVLSSYTGDLNLWTLVDSPSLKGLHDAALLSVFSTTNSVPIK